MERKRQLHSHNRSAFLTQRRRKQFYSLFVKEYTRAQFPPRVTKLFFLPSLIRALFSVESFLGFIYGLLCNHSLARDVSRSIGRSNVVVNLLSRGIPFGTEGLLTPFSLSLTTLHISYSTLVYLSRKPTLPSTSVNMSEIVAWNNDPPPGWQTRSYILHELRRVVTRKWSLFEWGL